MTCCAEGGEILIFPHEGSYEDANLDYKELQVASTFEEVIAPALEGRSHREREMRIRPPAARPWVARVPESEEEEWLERLRAREDVRIACPNWHLSLAAPMSPPEPRERSFSPDDVAEFLAGSCPALNAGGYIERQSELHVAVIDSGISRQAICCESRLNPVQLDIASFGSCWRSEPFDEVGHGTVVAAIVHMLAPRAKVTSVRCFRGKSARLSDIVYGLLAVHMLEGPIHLVNLSLSVNAGVERCRYCQREAHGPTARAQMEAVLEYIRWAVEPCPLFIAAGGERGRLATPACIPGVIAVGSMASASPPVPTPSYPAVGQNFVFAPGGSSSAPIEAGGYGKFYGTSFATAVVTGLLARDRTGNLDAVIQQSWAGRVSAQEQLLGHLADTEYPGYDRETHGLGLMH